MIMLDRFHPRPYQIPFYEAMENSNGKYRNAIIVHPRRTGKDFGIGLQYAVRHALRKRTTVLYFLKSYSQAKGVIWDAITNDGIKFLDIIPTELVETMNSSELKIVLKNGSIISFRSAENFEKSVVGSNASLIIFSEFATYNNAKAYEFAAPIVAANGGQLVFLTTPRGRNFFWDLWKKAQTWDNWYCELKTLDDTKHIDDATLEQFRKEHSEEFVAQELFCSFDRGIEGSFYAKYIMRLQDEGRIGHVPYDPSLPVSTAWDLGYNDQTVIIMYQITKNNLVRVIDCYANTNQPLSHYIKWLKNQDYVYAKHFAPHDIEIHDYSTGQTRIQMARELGLIFETREQNNKLCSATPKVSVADGIERVWTSFSRLSMDEKKCATLIKALESYHREWDDDKKVYKQTPLHDWSSDYADAFRYMCLTIDMNQRGMTEEDARKGYNQAMFSNSQGPLDYPFNEDNNIKYRGFF